MHPRHGHPSHVRLHNGLPRWQRRATDLSGSVLLGSGLAWLVLHYAVAGELPHPLEPWSLRLHGLAGMAALFMLGVLAAAHIPRGLRLRGLAQRRSGLILCSLAGSLVASAWLLYYFAPDNVRPALGSAHSAAGAAMAVALVVHRRAAPKGQPVAHPAMTAIPTTPLLDLPDGGRAIVTGLSADVPGADEALLRRLAEIGFVAGEPVQVLRRGPGGREPLAVQIGDTLFALRALEARCVLVQVAANPSGPARGADRE
jgi:Fe2+ transport system protein FeoA